MDRERSYKILSILLTILVGGVLGLALTQKAYLVALTVFFVGLVLHMVLRWFYRDVILVDERVVRIYDRASAQTLRVFLVSIGSVYVVVILLRSLGFTLNNLYLGLLPFVYTALVLMLLHTAFYTYYRRKM